MKAFVLISHILFPLLIVLSAPAVWARPAPALVCDDTEYFFGAVQNTNTVVHDFIVSNEGNAPLSINSTRSDCGCILMKITEKELKPGATMKLSARFDLKGRSGKQVRKIIIESNDPEHPRLMLAMIGEALARLEIVPDRIYWGNIHNAAVTEKSCEIRFSEQDESYINSVTLPETWFTNELTVVKPRRIYKLVMRTVPPMPIRSFASSVRLATDHPRFKTIEIPMLGRVTGDIFTMPEEITLDAKDAGVVSRVILVYSGLKKRFGIIKVEAPSPDIKVAVRAMSLGGGYRINLHNIPPTPDLDGKTITITTDCETMPVISVPIKYLDKD